MVNIISQIGFLIEDILSDSCAKISKKSKSFITEVLIFYTIMQKVNFTQLSRYGSRCEKTYRENFKKKSFKAVSFNLEVAKRYFSDSLGAKAIAIDPSYISKTGKHTPGAGYFWSGVAQKSKWGLEILGIGIIDAEKKECIMLQAIQTPDNDAIASKDVNKEIPKQELLKGSRAISDFEQIKSDLPLETVKGLKRQYRKKNEKEQFRSTVGTADEERFNLISWYLHAIGCLPEDVIAYTQTIVADAYFSKRKFVDGLIGKGLHLVSRFRDDAALMNIYKGEKTGKPGRPQIYAGKVDYDNLDMKVFFKLDYVWDGGTCYAGFVYSKALKRKVKVVIWFSDDRKKRKIFFSTDFTMAYTNIIKIYRTRFQEEFAFRDTKNYLSLNRCQARDMRKQSFSYNMSFTALNCMKYVAKQNGVDFSVCNMKTLIHGEYLMRRFINVSGINPNDDLINKLYLEVCSLTRKDWAYAS